jgi:hypothetical protein
MLPFFLGLLASFFLIVAKYGLAKIILYKKNYLFWSVLTILSELLVVALAYSTLGLLGYTGEKFIYGFSIGLVTLLLFYVISHTLKKSDED